MSDCRFGVSPVNYPDPDPSKVYGNCQLIPTPLVIFASLTSGVQLKDDARKMNYYYLQYDRTGKVYGSCLLNRTPLGGGR